LRLKHFCRALSQFPTQKDFVLSNPIDRFKLEGSIFYLRDVNRDEALAKIEEKVNSGKKLSLTDYTFLILLPMCGKKPVYDREFLIKCVVLAQKFFNRQNSSPKTQKMKVNYASYIAAVYGKMLTDRKWRELFDMPETNSLVKIVTNILFKDYREDIKEEVRAEVRAEAKAKVEAKVKAEKLKMAHKLLEERKLERSEALQIFGLTDQELKAPKNGSALGRASSPSQGRKRGAKTR
jgi:hypothetical protein